MAPEYPHHHPRQWSPQRRMRPLAADPAERRASTMDSDKKRVFLERLRANPFPMAAATAHYGTSRKQRQQKNMDPRSHSQETSR